MLGSVPTHAAFLPGASGRGEFWAPVAERLNGVRATLFDYPGFGGLAPDPSFGSYDDLARHVIGRLPGPSAVIGQSMGGVVAVLVAARRPDLVTHLVLAVTSGGLDLAAFGADDWRPGSRAAHPGNPAWMWDDAPDLGGALAALATPTLLVWATRDPISPLAVGEHLATRIPRARLVAFDSDDHWVARVHAAEVAAEIESLLAT